MARRDLRTYKYQQLRAAFLADKTHCHWCRRPVERLTVDHLVPVALMEPECGLDPLDVGNWVPACLTCNARRGALLRHRLNPRRRPQLGFAPSREW